MARNRGIAVLELAAAAGTDAGTFALAGAARPPLARPGLAGPDDVLLALHTSGTAARPKLVPLTHRNVVASARDIAAVRTHRPRPLPQHDTAVSHYRDMGVAEDLRCLWRLVFRLHGLGPVFRIHIDERDLSGFDEAGFERAYRRVAEVLRLHPTVKGAVGTSWTLDPQLDYLSPKLSNPRRCQIAMAPSCASRVRAS